MGVRVVEETIRSGRFGPTIRLRVDLHGVSTFGPGKHHRLIRWEAIIEITPDPHGVTVASETCQIVFPSGVFGFAPNALAERLEQAGSIFKRGDVIEELMMRRDG